MLTCESTIIIVIDMKVAAKSYKSRSKKKYTIFLSYYQEIDFLIIVAAFSGNIVDLLLITICCQEIDEVTDDMTEAMISGVSKSASSFWNIASGEAFHFLVE